MTAPPRAAFALVTGLFVVLMGATWFRHTDVGDAQLYEVIARHMLRSGDWFALEYLGQPFFDHLPFGIWPIAAAQALSPRAVIPLHALFSVLTVLLVGVNAQRLAGSWAALTAMFTLATSQFYFFQTSYPTLDPLLLLLTTASVLPIFTGQGSRAALFLAWLCAALAVAVKGPFGLLPLGGALGARVLVDRSWRHARWGAVVFVLAAAPVAAFVLLNSEWREGYGVRQLLASATGERTDGSTGSMLALRFIADRFWPWFPLLFLALGCTRKSVASRKLGVACALVLLGLSLPHRKLWHHTLVVYPLLAMWIGVSLGPWLGQRLSSQATLRGLSVALAVAVLAVIAGVDRLLMARPCVLATDFSVEFARPGEVVAVVSEQPEWDMLSALAFERDVTPRRVATWEEAEAPVALATDASWETAPPAWKVRARARGWVLATRGQ